MNDFNSLGLPAPILKALGDEGYAQPTPIQAQAIPPVLKGADLLGIAQTGTGKTAAFALPILARLAADRRMPPARGCRVLVLSPTRELASQIGDSFRTYGRHLRVSVAVVFGGVPYRPQLRATAGGVDVLVATPGRLLDHMGERNIDLSGTEVFVLDEADQMLDLGFLKPIRNIIARLPRKRQNLFFSATMPREIGDLAGELLADPVRVSVAPAATTVERVTQRVIRVEASAKRALLVEILRGADMTRTLVFTRTKRGADRVAGHLEQSGIFAAAIHGNKSQRQRTDALSAFRDGRVPVLVATDIAARGIDIEGVSHVVNFELPEVPDAYVHRIGRTARAGASGGAVSLCDNSEIELLRAIEKRIRMTVPLEDRRGTVAAGEPRGREAEPRQRRHAGRGDARPARADQQRSHRRDEARSARREDRRGPPAIADVAFLSAREHPGKEHTAKFRGRAGAAGDRPHGDRSGGRRSGAPKQAAAGGRRGRD